MQTSRFHTHGDYPGSLQMFFCPLVVSTCGLYLQNVLLYGAGVGSRSKVFDVQNRGSELGPPESTEMPGIVRYL